ncbi:cytosine deaminase protein-like protein [Patellaria atrata CBS 101060]|uniref:Cytosine deaminase protein-like protein n=1 Tax=Patellaria atrata CBS 101060 TaxID=1346257 RepID=A0A9P4SCJ7_9PEZI|nr:cytosine deaminase protein-like protein [Patellaria atrata CBS 101060]
MRSQRDHRPHIQHISTILGVRLPRRDPNTLWDISIDRGQISQVTPHETRDSSSEPLPGVLDATGRLIAPSLCHAHIHLDKCFLLQDPKFADLQITKGNFEEAMELTSQAKSRFEEEDLLRRGRRLVEESINFGVTSMRAFVEVDRVVQLKCLTAGLILKKEFIGRCDIQICAFAQLPLFSGYDGDDNNCNLLAEAATRYGVDVLGSAPYVEENEQNMVRNVYFISKLAVTHGKHLDFHMDYNIDSSSEPFIWSAFEVVKSNRWFCNASKGKLLTFGHCTRLIFFNTEEWIRLRHMTRNFPISFIGLPTSDLFMMRSASKVRGTLDILEMIKAYGLKAAISVNNVGNAFTPQGNVDPLSVACLGVAVYQAATKEDTEILFESVSTRAKRAIGLRSASLDISPGEPADFVIFDAVDASWRNRKSISEVVYDAGIARQTIKAGLLVS